jgi:hypothetical protein
VPVPGSQSLQRGRGVNTAEDAAHFGLVNKTERKLQRGRGVNTAEDVLR